MACFRGAWQCPARSRAATERDSTLLHRGTARFSSSKPGERGKKAKYLLQRFLAFPSSFMEEKRESVA